MYYLLFPQPWICRIGQLQSEKNLLFWRLWISPCLLRTLDLPTTSLTLLCPTLELLLAPSPSLLFSPPSPLAPLPLLVLTSDQCLLLQPCPRVPPQNAGVGYPVSLRLLAGAEGGALCTLVKVGRWALLRQSQLWKSFWTTLLSHHLHLLSRRSRYISLLHITILIKIFCLYIINIRPLPSVCVYTLVVLGFTPLYMVLFLVIIPTYCVNVLVILVLLGFSPLYMVLFLVIIPTPSGCIQFSTYLMCKCAGYTFQGFLSLLFVHNYY